MQPTAGLVLPLGAGGRDAVAFRAGRGDAAIVLLAAGEEVW